jgi:hypothetical protein
MRVDVQLPDASVVQVYADGKAWIKDPGGVRDAPPEMLADFAASAKRDVLQLLLGAATAKLKARFVKEEGFEGRVLKVIALSSEESPEVRLHIDPQTASVVKVAYETRLPNDRTPRPTEEVFSDYRTVDGVSLPFKGVVVRAGMVVLERQLTSVQVNPVISADLFVKPR